LHRHSTVIRVINCFERIYGRKRKTYIIFKKINNIVAYGKKIKYMPVASMAWHL